ncbi:pentatricopeptide repeat (PPR) superfamily protein [Tasmannia lanceolata]|uniref:pentatricopeptide repeat (PPR) superfamily protein n=1 Tax=Tasmannia lanceolata TaxID=3420 RepID=UPI0040628370
MPLVFKKCSKCPLHTNILFLIPNASKFLQSMSLNKFFICFNPSLTIPPNTQISSSLKSLILTATLHNSHPYYHNLCSDKESKIFLSSSPPQIKYPNQNSKCINQERRISEEFCSTLVSFCNSRSLKDGVSVHCPIIKLGFQDDLFLNNNLLSLYSKCIGVDQARVVFDKMPQRDVVSWTGIISAYVRDGNNEQALELFDQMVFSGLTPNEFTFSSVLRSCSSLGEFEQGIRVQTQIIKLGFESNHVLGSALMDFYSKCNKVDEAFEIFVTMNNKDTVSWTTMISACTKAEDWIRAWRLYSIMIQEGVPPNEFTFVKLLMASGFLGLNYGKLVHAHIILWGIKLNLVLKTALADMYSKCKHMEDAVKILNQTPESDVLLWTAMISGYTQVSDFNGAFSTFREMELSGISPNSFAYAGVLTACSSTLALKLGEQIHSRTIKVGLEHDISVGNSLVDMYMKCSSTVEGALCVFKRILYPNIVSWTSLIAGYARHGYNREAFQAFSEMRVAGLQPNSITLSTILKGTVEAPIQIRKLHAYIYKTKLHSDTTVGNSLVDAYSKVGMVDDAWQVIKLMTHRDVITYTSLATGVNQMGHHEMALDIISLMNDDDVKMDDFSLTSFLSASACLAAMEPGRQLHCYSVKSGLNEQISVSNGLVDLYGKCGSVSDAHRAFRAIRKPNVVSWNGLISALASNGYFSVALSSFEDMRLAGIGPDGITFLLVLYACSHGGLVDLGLEYFNSMSEFYSLSPQLDHYVCLVDLLGRAGRVEEAANVIETMPFRPDALIYKTLLGSCKVHHNLALGEHAARNALELDPGDPAVYVLLSNMYDDAGKSDYGEQIRRMMRDRGVRKNPGQSWVEIRNKVYVFGAGDRSNPQINEIHEKIESLMVRVKNLGYCNVENGGSSYHSEKLAIGFALLNTPSTAVIRIIKNLRICGDCHTFISVVSRVVDREIIVRDGNRFHSFKKGECSCGGYW